MQRGWSQRIAATLYTDDSSRPGIERSTGQKNSCRPYQDRYRRVGVGIGWENAADFAEKVTAKSNIDLQGCFYHLATSDEVDKSFARKQLHAFSLRLKACGEKGSNRRLFMPPTAERFSIFPNPGILWCGRE
jgi:hypothetical protein